MRKMEGNYNRYKYLYNTDIISFSRFILLRYRKFSAALLVSIVAVPAIMGCQGGVGQNKG
jgi:hypothetical protein